MPQLLDQLNLQTLKLTSWVLTVNTAGVLCIGLVCLKQLDQFSERFKIIFGGIFFAMGYALTPFFLTMFGLAMTTLICIVGELLWLSPMMSKIYDAFDKSEYGQAAAIENLIKSLGLFFSPILGSVFFIVFKQNTALYFAILFALIPLLAAFLLKDN